jgi:Tfp pilus assembly protein PilX
MHDTFRNPSRQRGAATLLVSMVLLIAATLLVLYTSQTTVFEQRMAANEVRERQAMGAAQAGADYAVALLLDGGTVLDTIPNTAITSGSAPYSSYRTAYCGNSLPITYFDANAQCGATPAAGVSCTAPTSAADGVVWVVSCGWSDDNTARKRILSYVGKSDALPYSPKNPLTARGSVSTSSSITIINYFTNLTIWSGDAVDFSGGSAKTYVRAPSVAAPSSGVSADTFNLPASGCNLANGTPNSCPGGGSCTSTTYMCTSSSATGAPDVVASDTSLSRLTSDQFFANFMGTTPDLYPLKSDQQVAGADFASLNGTTGQVLWVDGDVGSPGGGFTLGTAANPVVVVIDGNVSGSWANVTIHGFVYVRGNWSSSGSPLIVGAMVMEGAFTGSGGPEIVYDPLTLGTPPGGNKWSPLPGGWRDW